MNRLTRSLVAAAVLAVFTQTGLAQTRVDRSGALDANKQVGSYGRNNTGGRPNPWEIQNNIVYGNVTGGKQFRGATASTDPQAFRGATGSRNFDNFVRDSSSVTTGGITSYNANTSRTYYGDSRVVAPPAGYVGVRNTGGYTPPVPTAWQNFDPRTTAVSSDPTAAYRTGTFTTAGNVDPTFGPGAAVAPLTQGQPLNGSNLSDYTNLNSDNTANFTPGQIKQLQGDGNASQIPGQTPQNGTNPVEAGSQPLQTGPRPSNTPGPTNQQSGNGTTTGMTGTTALDDSVSNSVTGPNAPEAGTVTRMTDRTTDTNKPDATGTAARAAADDAIAKRPGGAAELASRDFNAQVRAAKAAKDKAAADGTKDASKDGNDKDGKDAAKPDDANATQNPSATPLPGKTGTFAGDATNQGMNDLLTKAQGQMKDGKFATAIDTFNAAEAIAPGNSQVRLGRANAELGGAYYRRAESTFRQAAVADPKVVASPTDLRALLGDERLQTAQKDLADLVQKNPADTGAAVLLAYVYYNTGNERRALALLDLADKRASGRDMLVSQLKTDWAAKVGDETK